jgi:hypothetical protein
MSMNGMPQGRGDVGESVASFPTYEAAQKAVSALIAGDVPAREIAIVGSGVRSVERVTGRLGYAAAARTGAINGLLLGLLFSAIFVLGNAAVPISAFIGVMFVGIAIGMLLSIISYSILRRRRDFASVMQFVAERYEVTVMPTSIHRARQIMGATAAPVRTTVVRPPTDEPPKYGERLPAAGGRAPEPGAAVAAEEPAQTSGPPAAETTRDEPSAEELGDGEGTGAGAPHDGPSGSDSGSGPDAGSDDSAAHRG